MNQNIQDRKVIKMAVIGSRTITDRTAIWNTLETYLQACPGELHLVSGGAKGADTIAEEFAKKHGLAITVIYPDWEGLGRKAGYMRNHRIWKEADCGVAFWDGKSRGTEHNFKIAKDLGKKLIVVQMKPHQYQS